MKPVGFITPDGLEGSNALLVYGRLNTLIYRVYNININMYTPRRRRVGPCGAATCPECHVASTWDPREILNTFCNFLIIFNVLNKK